GRRGDNRKVATENRCSFDVFPLFKFCHCSVQQDCEPHRRHPLYQVALALGGSRGRKGGAGSEEPQDDPLPSPVSVDRTPLRAASSASCSTWELLWVTEPQRFPFNVVPRPHRPKPRGPQPLLPQTQEARFPVPPPPNPGVWLAPLDPQSLSSHRPPFPGVGPGSPAHFPLLPAAWICILRYHQLRDWGVGKWPNQMILWSGLLCALGTSVVGNFQQKNQQATHLTGAFFALFVGHLYFWLQLLLSWRMKSLPQPGAPWIRPLRLVLCSLCTVLMVAMVILHTWLLRSASAACEWAVAMLLFTLFGLLAVDFSGLDSCTLCLQPGSSLSPPPPASPISLQAQPAQAL
uniref:CWH43-like N-terminal domain-containing protein n=1 Tax=Rhinolophus ferrumequinum TaxID=59479 RepID=A0A671FUP6_RHIFE